MDWADLHLHSNCSDGSDPPEEVAARAHALGARAFALTDHDTTAGHPSAAEAAAHLGIEFVPAVEISTVFERAEVHILAFFIDAAHEGLQAALFALRDARAKRTTLIIERLRELGMDVGDAMTAEDGASPGRMHIAAAMAAKGIVKRPQDAFNKYLNPGKPGYVPREKIDAARAVDLVHAAGGLAFVAHPGLNRSLRKLLPQLLALPFDGIEAQHSAHTPGRAQEFADLAAPRGLLITGGSDCHGGIKGRREMGRVRLPYRHVEAMKAKLQRP